MMHLQIYFLKLQAMMCVMASSWDKVKKLLLKALRKQIVYRVFKK